MQSKQVVNNRELPESKRKHLHMFLPCKKGLFNDCFSMLLTDLYNIFTVMDTTSVFSCHINWAAA